MFPSPAAWSTMCSVNGVCVCQVHSQTYPGVEIQASMIIRMHARRQQTNRGITRTNKPNTSGYLTFVPANAPANHTCAGMCNQRQTVNLVTAGKTRRARMSEVMIVLRFQMP